MYIGEFTETTFKNLNFCFAVAYKFEIKLTLKLNFLPENLTFRRAK